MLAIEDLTVSYQNHVIFQNTSIRFETGKITGIIGPNGAGKSTLMKAALGLIKTQSGKVSVDCVPLQKKRQHVAYVEQRATVDLHFPIHVLDVVLTGTYPKLGLFKSPSRNEVSIALNALEQVDLLPFAQRQIGCLSGGQLQRVFVARAIVQDAAVVILDEPFVGIDMQSEAKIMSILKSWKAQNKTIIVIHHDLNKVTDYFDDVAIIQRGVVAKGAVADTYTLANIQQAFSADFSHLLFR